MWLVLVFLFLFLIGLLAITTLPIILPFLLCFTVLFKRPWVFTLALLSGAGIDFLLLRPLGQTGVFFILFIFIVLLYEKKFEIQTMHFAFFSGFLGSLGYLFVFGYNHILEQALICALLGALIFKLFYKYKLKD